MERINILLVEDEAIIAMMEQKELEKKGYSVHHVSNGEQAVKIVLNGAIAIDLVLMDIDLGSGIDGTQAAKQILDYKDMPIVFLSSHTEPDIVEKTEKITSYGYVVKNSGITVLDASIKMAMKLFDAKMERKHAEGTLVEHERFLSSIIENIPDMIFIKDAKELRFMKFNLAGEKLLGIPRNEMIGKNDHDFFPKEQADFFALKDKEVLESGELFDISEEIIDTKSGRKILHTKKIPIMGSDGKPAYLLGISEDITEHKRTERELTLLNFALNNVREAAFLIDINARFHYINDYACLVLGYTRNDLLKLSVSDVAPDFPAERWLVHWHDLQKNHWLLFESRLRAKDGHIFPVEISANYFEYDGQCYNLALVRDITERKRAEEALYETNEDLRAMLEAVPVAIFDLDTEGIVKNIWNPAAERLLGWSRQEALGHFLPSVPEDKKEEFRQFREQIKDGKYLTGVDVRRQRKDGSPIEYSIYGAPLYDIRGKVKGNIAVLIDLTERRQTEKKLRQLNRDLRALSNCNQTLLRAKDELTLLKDICRIICDEAGYRMAWVGYAEHDDAKTVRPVAWAGFEDGYLANISITWADTEKGYGPGGTSIRNGKTVYVQDISTDSRMLLWREQALQRGYRSTIAFPLKDENNIPFGGLIIYSSEINAFSTEEINLLEELAGDLAFGITTLRLQEKRIKTEEKLRINEERYRMAQAIGHVGNWEYDIQTATFWGSDEAKRIYGFDPEQQDFTTDEVENCIPERERVHQALVDLIEKNKEYNLEFEILPRNSPEPRIITSVAKLQRDEDGKPLKIIGVIQDVTNRKQTEKEIQRQLQEKDLLLKEIHHRVKNNITNIEGMLSLQVNSQSNRDVQLVLHNAISRIRSMRVLYEKLLITENYQDIPIKKYTESLIDLIVAIFSESVNVTIKKKIQDFSLVAKKAISVGIIINELLTNAFKYAFLNRNDNSISILIERKENIVTLIIHDNGIGYDYKIAATESRGLGLTIVRMLVNQLQGYFTCEKENGTKIVVQFEI